MRSKAILAKLFLTILIIFIFSCESSTRGPFLNKPSTPLMSDKKMLSPDTYSRPTQFFIDDALMKAIDILAESSLVPLKGTDVFVWRIIDGESNNRNNKFSIIVEDNLKRILQTNYKVNVFNFETISSKHYKALIKEMRVKYILSGSFHKFRDGLSLNIELMTTKESKIVASSTVAIKQSLYQRVINMDYVGEDTDDDYFMKLKVGRR